VRDIRAEYEEGEIDCCEDTSLSPPRQLQPLFSKLATCPPSSVYLNVRPQSAQQHALRFPHSESEESEVSGDASLI
jgi:hypothetical protein